MHCISCHPIGEMSIERGLQRLPTLLAAASKIPIEQTIIEGCGHWIQQEAPAQVNAKLLEFLGKHKARFCFGFADSTGAAAKL